MVLHLANFSQLKNFQLIITVRESNCNFFYTWTKEKDKRNVNIHNYKNEYISLVCYNQLNEDVSINEGFLICFIGSRINQPKQVLTFFGYEINNYLKYEFLIQSYIMLTMNATFYNVICECNLDTFLASLEAVL